MNRIELTERYRRADLACAKVHYRLNSTRMYERELLIPDAATQQDLLSQLAAARAEVAALETPEPVFRLMKQHFTDFLDSACLNADNFFAKPSSAVSGLTWKLENAASVDSRPDEEKAELLIHQLGGVNDLLAAAKANISDAAELAALADECAYVRENFRHYAENIGKYFPALSPASAQTLEKAVLAACAALDEQVHTANTNSSSAPTADDESKRIPFTEEYYRNVLNDTLGVKLDALLSWHAEEIEKTRAEVFEIASRLPIAEKPRTMREVNEVLNRYAGACDTPEEMFKRMQGYLDRAQEAARGYVWFPEEVCRLQPVPFPLRYSFPWGGYSDGDVDEAKEYIAGSLTKGLVVKHRAFGEGVIEECTGTIFAVHFAKTDETKKLGLTVAIGNGLVSLPSEEMTQKIKEYIPVLNRETQIPGNLSRAIDELQPYLEYLD